MFGIFSFVVECFSCWDDEHTLVEAQNIDFGMMTDDKEERIRELKLTHGRQEAIVVTHIEAKTLDNCLTIGDIPDQVHFIQMYLFLKTRTKNK